MTPTEMRSRGPSGDIVLLSQSTCYFDLEGAEAAADFVNRTSLTLSKGEYYVKRVGDEIHIYGVDRGVGAFDFQSASERQAVTMRPDGVELAFNRKDISKLVLHSDPLGKSPKDLMPPAIDKESVAFAPELRAIREIQSKTTGKLSPDQMLQVRELLERVRVKREEQLEAKKKGSAKPSASTRENDPPIRPSAPPKALARPPRPTPPPTSSRSYGGG